MGPASPDSSRSFPPIETKRSRTKKIKETSNLVLFFRKSRFFATLGWS
jgi:hypothetical protein